MAVDLVLGEAVLIEVEEVVVEMNGIADLPEEICLAEEVTPRLEEADLNIQLPVMILVQNITLVSVFITYFLYRNNIKFI